MGIWLFLIFVGLPIVEIALFVVVGGAIGVLDAALVSWRPSSGFR